ncbi:MAG: hypothetical protein ACR2PF_10250 [Rhizobiaceae bacterium]
MGSLFSRDLNILVFLVSGLLVAVLVKGLTYLPQRYYFTFSQVVDAKNTTQFIAGPELPSPEAYCRIVSASLITPSGETRAPDFENGPQVVSACNAVQRNSDVKFLSIPSNAEVDGQKLVSKDLRNANTAVIEFFKTNQPQVVTAMFSGNILVKKNVAALSSEEIEKILAKDGGFEIVNVLAYMADDPTAQVWLVRNTLAETTNLGFLVQNRQELFSKEIDGLRTTSNWLALATQYRNLQLASELDLLRKSIRGRDNLKFWPAVLLKIMPAFVGAFLIGLLWKERAIFDAPVAAGFVAFLFCWPMIALWDAVVAPEWKDYRNSFFALYIAYVLSYFFAAKLGAMLVLKLPNVSIPEVVASKVDWGKIATTAVGTIVTSGVTAAITWTFASG